MSGLFHFIVETRTEIINHFQNEDSGPENGGFLDMDAGKQKSLRK